jgi:hypothetical protein
MHYTIKAEKLIYKYKKKFVDGSDGFSTVKR